MEKAFDHSKPGAAIHDGSEDNKGFLPLRIQKGFEQNAQMTLEVRICIDGAGTGN